ncbi:MAG: CPBP family intramembrane metalloprotease [Acidobacteria bacterium]|nr:CPBP family intramembrane metalloprotease [Acidobacteriota bacterium]
MSTLLFGIPSLIFAGGLYIGLPTLDQAGVPLYLTFQLFATGPLALLFLGALVGYRLEGNSWSWDGLIKRFRLGRPDAMTWLWTAGLILWAFSTPALLSFTREWIYSFAPPPQIVSGLFNMGPDRFLGTSITGNWWLFFGFLVFTFFNVFGEEFWWRGYILPRQELTHGEWAWVVHGLLWNLFHVFFYWRLITLLPITLAVAFVAQKRKNTWPGIIAHFGANSLTLYYLAMGALR